MYQVSKRDGKIVEFDIEKISAAITKAFEATETNYTPSVINFLALMVTADFEPKIKDGLISVEAIQDSVERCEAGEELIFPGMPRPCSISCLRLHPAQ